MTIVEMLEEYRDAFMNKVSRPSWHDCWDWYNNSHMRGQQVGFVSHGHVVLVANAMWYYFYGYYPTTRLRRVCANERCVNPLHLYMLSLTGRQHRFKPEKGIEHMSMYCEVKTEFKDEGALVAALMETGNWKQEQIEVHQDAQNLFGYHGDMRAQKAHVIIRRAYVGEASNDIGFEKNADGSYKAHISQFDSHKYDEAWLGKLKGNYAYQVIQRQQAQRGRTVQRERLPDGKQRIVIQGYR